MFHECLGVVNAVPGEQGVCLGCLGVVFYCLGVFWGLLEGVSVLSEVSGSAFYSNLIYINCALIKSLTFSKRRGGPRCLKYQNVPTSRSFWPIGNPWERFQSWDIRVYFIPVPDDHTHNCWCLAHVSHLVHSFPCLLKIWSPRREMSEPEKDYTMCLTLINEYD